MIAPNVGMPNASSISFCVFKVSSKYSIRKATPSASIAPTTAAKRVLGKTRGDTGFSGTFAASTRITLSLS